ncbi:MAG: hypothetical protein IKD79_04875, partial [Oscillospiraceae bacterium]|nr:hypothetical protein [Oscillospiraceae bacterium]
MIVPEGKLQTILRDGVEIAAVPGEEYAPEEILLTDALDIRHSCELSPDKSTPYRAGLYVTGDGVRASASAAQVLRGGRYDDAGAEDVTVESRSPAFSAVIAEGGSYSLKGAKLHLLSDSDGREVCDFVGLGSAVAAFRGARVELEDCEIATEGVAKCTLYADDGSDVVAKNCRLSAMGGELYEGYKNSADFNYMVAPPWVLGIAGNARGTNLMGDKAAMVIVDSEVKARNWGALSTDNGEGNLLAVVDSDLTVTGGPADKKDPYLRRWGSGYGTYILGCDEDFRGARISAGTYIGIARDGNAVYRSSRGPVRYVSPSTGEVLYEGEGKGRITELNSDVFGIMAHGSAELTLTEGTVMNTGAAAFLMRCGGVRILVKDGAKVNPADGVLLQIIDDDDATVGVDWGSDIELEFHTEFREKEGWPSENGQISSLMPPPDPSQMPPPPPPGEEPPPPPGPDVHFTVRNTALAGDLYNGSGYYGQKAKQLYLTLGEGAELTGSVSATETIHVDEKGNQNTHFTIDQYYYLGHVANRYF